MPYEERQRSARTLESLSKTLAGERERLSRKRGGLERISKELDDRRAELEACKSTSELSGKAHTLLSKVSSNVRVQSVGAIEKLVTAALREVFTDRDVKFIAEVSQDVAKPSVKVYVEQNGRRMGIMDSRGLGMADLISIAIQISLKSMYRPRISLPIVLDERLKFLHSVSENSYATNAYRFLARVAEQLGEQVIIVTGEKQFLKSRPLMQTADRIFLIEQVEGKSRAKVVWDKKLQEAPY